MFSSVFNAHIVSGNHQRTYKAMLSAPPPEWSFTMTSVSLMAGSPAGEVRTSNADVASVDCGSHVRCLSFLQPSLQGLLGCAPRAPSSGQSASGTVFPKLSKWVLCPGTDQVRTAGAGSWEVSGPSLQGLPLLHPPTPFPAFRASTPCLPGPLAGKLGQLRLFSPQSVAYFL